MSSFQENFFMVYNYIFYFTKFEYYYYSKYTHPQVTFRKQTPAKFSDLKKYQ